MEEKAFQRPDEAALFRVLEKHRRSCAGFILRLAWNMGLSTTEMHGLKWNEVLLEGRRIQLPDRSVPMDEDTWECLQARYMKNSRRSEYVVISDRRRVHMHRVNISVAAHEALESEESLRNISLKDLREDFVIRQLEQHDGAYVARISGLTLATLTSRYGQYCRAENSGGPEEPLAEDELEARLYEAVQREGPTPEGLAIWMSWQLGL